MIKRILLILLCLTLMGMACVSATETSGEEIPTQAPVAAEEMPMRGGGGMGGRRGGMGGTPPGGEMPAMPEGEAPAMPEGEAPAMRGGEAPAMPDGETRTMPQNGMSSQKNQEALPTEENVGQVQTAGSLLEFVKTYETPIVSVVLLAFAFVFVLFYKHRNY